MLLSLTDETSSVRLACQRMQLSYSAGWNAINLLERELGCAVVERSQGGAHGGRSRLTERGRELLDAYQNYNPRPARYGRQALRGELPGACRERLNEAQGEAMKQFTRAALSAFMIVLGVALSAFAMSVFVLPFDILAPGVTGLGRTLGIYFGADVSLVVWISNIALLLLGLVVLGWRFAASIVLGSVCFPLFLDLFDAMPWLSAALSDPLYAAICAGVLEGVGLGLVIRAGGSSGGQRRHTDYPQPQVPPAHRAGALRRRLHHHSAAIARLRPGERRPQRDIRRALHRGHGPRYPAGPRQRADFRRLRQIRRDKPPPPRPRPRHHARDRPHRAPQARVQRRHVRHAHYATSTRPSAPPSTSTPEPSSP